MLAPILKRIGLKFSINDPRWGRGSQDDNQNQNQNPQDGRRPEGPPDLDELWRDFNQRLSRLFGGKKGGGGGPGGFRPDMGNAGYGIFGIAAVVVLALWLLSGFFIVQEGQTGVVMTFGKYSHKAPAGFNWRWPTPIQTHEVVNVSQVRTAEVGYRGSVRNKQTSESLMLTEDENIIDIQFAVQYTLSDAEKWIFSNREQEEMVKQVAESALREVVGRNKMDFVLYEDRAKVAFDAKKLMQAILDRYNAGVLITNVATLGVQPPEQVQSAFDDAVKAGQDRERQKNEGQAYANDVIPRARGAGERLLQEAEAYRARVQETAQGDASRFKLVVTEYQKAPAVTRDRMYLETMQQIFSNTGKVMIDAKSGNNLLYLPLDKLIAHTASQEAATAARNAAAPTGSAAGSSEAAQALEAERATRPSDVRSSRDREGR
ncbi:FtsH protease activity modulator HflK [Janthinobacterium sp. 17J80-10]|uniref:FtsH protease activity modulator HflK n=1 Tax=Janthinobacterium sp. 17J80-10 TaxID=2497863 RepID=UPI001005A809|nr:FtsH protease activity modulator HflK [Janthinobacterium sp. 17J80-10]QAU34852.1 FtsH protease activity modulator HflK [Janthinobacterium sp. 17J80-10]